MNINEFISELVKELKNKDIKLNQSEMKIIITEFIDLISERVFDGEEVKIKNFATFYLDSTQSRNLPNGESFEKSDIIRVKLSKNFKRNS